MSERQMIPEERRAQLAAKQGGGHVMTKEDLEGLIAAWPGKDPTGQDFRDYLDQREARGGV
jgi:hypothetical protein